MTKTMTNTWTKTNTKTDDDDGCDDNNALWNKSNGSYDIKDFGPLPLIFSTSKYFRWKFQPCPSFFACKYFR